MIFNFFKLSEPAAFEKSNSEQKNTNITIINFIQLSCPPNSFLKGMILF